MLVTLISIVSIVISLVKYTLDRYAIYHVMWYTLSSTCLTFAGWALSMVDTTVCRFRYFDVSIKVENLREEVCPIIQHLRPAWTIGELHQETFSDGYVNAVCCFCEAADTHRQDALVVRVDGADDPMFARDKEFLSLQVAQAAGCFTTILASFKNGLVYQYARGHTMTFRDLNSPENIRNIAEKMHKLQTIDVSKVPLFSREGKRAKYDKTITTYQEVLSSIESIPREPKDKFKKQRFDSMCAENPKEYLMAEYEFIWNVLQAVNLPVSFSHRDLHPKNMIIDAETGDIHLIDFEMSGFHYRGMDFATLFECGPLYRIQGIKTTADDDDGITEESRDLYMRYYLQAIKTSEDLKSMVSADDMQLFDLELRILDIAMAFQGIPIGLAYVDFDLKDLDILDYATYCKEQYDIKRRDLLELKDRYLELKKGSHNIALP